jgi:hypothetical protein
MQITFEAPGALIKSLDDCKPEPISQHIPSWFRNIKHTKEVKTVKGCMPFMDALTMGYAIKLTHDMWVQHKKGEDGKYFTDVRYGNQDTYDPVLISRLGIEFPTGFQAHNPNQLKNSYIVEKNGGHQAAVLKFSNPWRIKTPPGYSTLFIAPMNNYDDRFQIVSGVIETDTWDNQINLPFIINSEKHPQLDTIIKRGTVIAQCIPFKRDDWKMNIEEQDMNKRAFKIIDHMVSVWRFYQDKYWVKKRWR